MKYPDRIEAIKEWLRKNEELIGDMERGKLEMNFNGNSMVFSLTDISPHIQVERKLEIDT